MQRITRHLGDFAQSATIDELRRLERRGRVRWGEWMEDVAGFLIPARRCNWELEPTSRRLYWRYGFPVTIQVQDTLTMEVHFHIYDREEGYEDDIRLWQRDSSAPELRSLEANEIGCLLTPDQAEQLAAALLEAARQRRATPSPWDIHLFYRVM